MLGVELTRGEAGTGPVGGAAVAVAVDALHLPSIADFHIQTCKSIGGTSNRDRIAPASVAYKDVVNKESKFVV